MEGHELNGIYDGYSFMPFLLGSSYATSFAHFHDFEPHAKNHMIPHYGMFSRFYFGRMMKSVQSASEKYSNFKKNNGPPYYQFNSRYAPLEHNDYLIKKGVSVKDVRMFEPKAQIAHTDHHDHAHH